MVELQPVVELTRNDPTVKLCSNKILQFLTGGAN